MTAIKYCVLRIPGDYLQGDAGNDTYLFSAGDGNTTINNYDTSVGHHDTLQLNVSSTDISARRTSSDLQLTVISTGEVITIDKHFLGNQYALNSIQFANATSWNEHTILSQVLLATQGNDDITGHTGDDTINGLGGDDSLHGGSGNDILQGGLGNDVLEGGLGNDRYLFNLGDGHDTINDKLIVPLFNFNDNGIDTLVFGENINPSHLTAQRGTGGQASDIIITVNTNDSVTLQGWFDGAFDLSNNLISPRKIEFLEFSNGVKADQNDILQLLDGKQLNFAPVIVAPVDNQYTALKLAA